MDSESHLGLNHLKVFSNKLVILVFVLLAEICSSSASSLLSLCIHSDGTIHYESTDALCCNLNDQGQGECGSFEEAHPDQADGFTPEDGCEDYGVFVSQVPINPPTTEEILLGGPERLDLLSIVALAPKVTFLELSVSSSFCGPPPDRIPIVPATVVLRI